MFYSRDEIVYSLLAFALDEPLLTGIACGRRKCLSDAGFRGKKVSECDYKEQRRRFANHKKAKDPHWMVSLLFTSWCPERLGAGDAVECVPKVETLHQAYHKRSMDVRVT